MTVSPTDLNLDEARRFLDALGAGEIFSFQTFVDRKATSKEEKQLFDKLACKRHGTFDQYAKELVRLNCLKESENPRGIYVTINRTNGKGRKAKDVIGVRAVFVDLDGAPIEPVSEGPLKPSIVVESSTKKFHAYWLLARDELSLDEFTSFQKMLAARFDGDPSINDLPRVLRIPGFFHRKGEPFLTRIVSLDPGLIYNRAQLIEAFGDPAVADERTNGAATADRQLTVANDHVAAAKAARIVSEAVERVARDPSRGRHAQALWIGWEARNAGLSEETAKFAAEFFCQLAPSADSDGIHRPLTAEEVQSAVLNAYADGKIVEREKRLSDFIITGRAIEALESPPRKSIIDPFLSERSLNMIYAKRGVGKTWVALQLGLSIAKGSPFLAWPVTEPRRVLYIDGEMPQSDLKERIMKLSGAAPPDNLMLLPSERLFLEARPLVINSAEDQQRILQALNDCEDRGERPDVLIFDNLSSLTIGMDENSNSDLDTLLPWLITLRHRGYTVIVVHHAGKGGQQRGASRREDLLDTSIKLEEVPRNARQGPAGACFTVSFEKTRGKRPDPDMLTVELINSAEGGLTWSIGTPASLSKDMKALIEIYESTPSSQKELANKIAVSEPRVSQLLQALRDKGLVTRKGLNLTKEGRERAEQLGAGSGPI